MKPLTYQGFVSLVEEIGLLSFHHRFDGGLARLQDHTVREQWFTGDPETDPWMWKDRAAQERALAFGSILGGHKGFASPALYPMLYAACLPDEPLEDRYADGKISQLVWRIACMFERTPILSSAQIRKELGATKKQGGSRVDGALVALQREFYICMCGNMQRINKAGLPYGWPANAYARADQYLADWISECLVEKQTARQAVLSHIRAVNPSADWLKLEKELFT